MTTIDDTPDTPPVTAPRAQLADPFGKLVDGLGRIFGRSEEYPLMTTGAILADIAETVDGNKAAYDYLMADDTDLRRGVAELFDLERPYSSNDDTLAALRQVRDEAQDRITDAHRAARGIADADVAAAASDAHRQGQAAGAGELLDLLTGALGTALEYHRPRQGLAYIAGALETIAEVHRRQRLADDARRAAAVDGAA